MIYTIVSLICIAIMIAILVWLLFKFLFKHGREERIEFIKSFKKGKCAIIYVVAVPLYFMADLYVGKGIGAAFFNSISKAVYLVVLKYDVPIALIEANAIYGIAIYMCFCLVVINAMMITFSVFHQAIWRAFHMLLFGDEKNDKCIIIGNNDKSQLVYDSCKCRKIIAGSFSKEEREKLYVSGVLYPLCDTEEIFYKWLTQRIPKILSKFKKSDRKINIIINNNSEKQNLNQCGLMLDIIKLLDDEQLPLLDIFVFGDREFEDIYAQYEAKSRGCLHYINEYQQIAVDFIDKYPLTEFMDQRQIDYRTSLLNPGIDINVAMIGFGRTNQQIFLSMVANNQFLTKDNTGNPIAKQVEYHLFDKLHTGNHKNLNHNYFRYKYIFSSDNKELDRDAYLPLPEEPSLEHYHYLDINDIRFYDDLKQSLSLKPNAINYIIVSLGMDYASVDMTNKIVAKLREWKLNNTYIFVRIRDQKTFNDSSIFLDLNYCHPFGAEKDVVYDYTHIIREKFSSMAVHQNCIYDIEHDMRHDSITEEEYKFAKLRWYTKKNTIERESNIYSCLSLRGKLHLMGLDYCKKTSNGEEGLSFEKYLSIYAGNDMPNFINDGKNQPIAVKYTLEYCDSRRKNMAIQEHQRWNAFMIMKGFVPATKNEILFEVNEKGKYTNGKNYAMRHHGNLTTFNGLEDFRKALATRDALPEENYDVIKYDYQLLDGAQWLLDKSGYMIIEKGDPS